MPARLTALAALDDAGAVVPLGAVPRARVDGSVIMPGARVGEGCRLRDVIVAPGTRLPDGLVVGHDPQEDALWFRVTPGGTTLVNAQMLARRAMMQPGPVLLPGRPTLARSR